MLKKTMHIADKSYAGIEVSLDELIALRHRIIFDPLQSLKHSRAISLGQNIAKLRGHGLEFDAPREYQPGDDIRRMAWRVTARSLKPHIKVYHEEKERPVWLAVDLSPSLYFGTRRQFKSVSSLQYASLLGWTYLQKHERIGAVIATTKKMFVHQPKPHEKHFLSLLKSFADLSKYASDFAEPNQLAALLNKCVPLVRSGNLLFILSDFQHFGTEEQKNLLYLSQQAQVTLIFVYDPFEATPPPAHSYIVSDGKTNMDFNMINIKNRGLYQEQFQTKFNMLKAFTQKYNMRLQCLRTDQDSVTAGSIPL